MDKTDLVNQELAALADRVLNGEITETIAGERVTLTADEPSRAAFYATWRTDIYDEEPAAVLDYTGNVPDEWREYVTEERGEIEAMAKASFEHKLAGYLENYGDKTAKTGEK